MTLMGASPEMHDGDFAFYFADIFVESVQYGNRTGLCEIMKLIKAQNYQIQLKMIREQAVFAHVAPQDYCRHQIMNTTVDINKNARQWTYQYCTEFGFYQVPSEKHAMRPEQLLGHDYWVDYCNTLFGVDLKINRTRSIFSFRHYAGTNTIFTNGNEDPWKWGTELHPNGHLGQVQIEANCNNCGHCGDLYTPKNSDPQELVKQRMDVMRFIDMHLKPFEEETVQFLQ